MYPNIKSHNNSMNLMTNMGFVIEKIQSSSIVAPDMITDPGIMMGSMVHTAASKDTLINQVFCIPRRFSIIFVILVEFYMLFIF